MCTYGVYMYVYIWRIYVCVHMAYICMCTYGVYMYAYMYHDKFFQISYIIFIYYLHGHDFCLAIITAYRLFIDPPGLSIPSNECQPEKRKFTNFWVQVWYHKKDRNTTQSKNTNLLGLPIYLKLHLP